MGKPFDVTVMHDLPERPRKEPQQAPHPESSRGLAELGAERIAGDIASLQQDPSKEEILLSIDSLRPDTNFLEKNELEALESKLRKAYNTKQLLMYLKEALRLSSLGTESVRVNASPVSVTDGGLRRTPWQSGKTPIARRRSRGEAVQRSETGKNKTKVVSQILRFAWTLEEVQSIGELEVHLQPWQLTYLFDLSVNGQPMHQTIIDNPLLRRRAELQAYSPHSVMRITATRLDAEEVLGLIERHLQDFRKLKMNTAPLRPLLDRPGWPDRFADIWDDAVRGLVGRHTLTVIELKKDCVTIRSTSDERLHSAKRLLLSWLELPSPGTIETFNWNVHGSEKSDEQHVNGYLLPLKENEVDLPLRFRDLQLGRLSYPIRRMAHGQDIDNDPTSESPLASDQYGTTDLTQTTGTRTLIKHLSSMPLALPFPNTPVVDTFMQKPKELPIRPPFWRAEVCRLLQPAVLDPSIIRSPQSRPGLFTIPTFPPHVTALMSNLLMKPAKHGSPALLAHFTPSPLTGTGVIDALQSLPRIVCIFSTDEEYKLTAVTARLCTQEVLVPFPGETVDLRFVRHTPAYLHLNTVKPDVEQFTRTLQASAANGESTLAADPEITITLPSLLMPNGIQHRTHKRSKSKDTMRVKYQFDRFEFIHSEVFLPHRQVESAVESAQQDSTIPEGLIKGITDTAELHIRDVDAALIGGRRSVLEIHNPWTNEQSYLHKAATASPSVDADAMCKDIYQEQTAGLVNSALAITRALTTLGTGESRMRLWGNGGAEMSTTNSDRRSRRARSRRERAMDRRLQVEGAAIPRTLGLMVKDKITKGVGTAPPTWRPRHFWRRDGASRRLKNIVAK
jgi:hypothetical protein